jgi:F-type H+-transporting ATPase subunit delta
MTGKQVQVETAVDSSMIGGMVTRIGSTVYDGSVRTQLAKMRQQLVEHS